MVLFLLGSCNGNTVIGLPKGTWVYPTKFYLDVEKGTEAQLSDSAFNDAYGQFGNLSLDNKELYILIHNSSSAEQSFSILYGESLNTKDDYANATEETKDWLVFDNTIVLQGNETYPVRVSFEIPKEVSCPNKFEFDLIVRPHGTGTISIQYGIDFFVQVRK